MSRLLIATTVAGGLLLTACSLVGPPKPEPATAILSKVPGNVPREDGVESTLLVAFPATSSAYNTTQMAYSEKPFQISYYRDNAWAAPPGDMIQPLLVHTLEQTGMFRAIVTAPETSHADYALRTELTELLQDYTRGAPVLRLGLHLQLLNGAGEAVADREISEQEPMRGSSSYAGVNAANDALAKALAEAAEFVMSSARSETRASSATSRRAAGNDDPAPRRRADR